MLIILGLQELGGHVAKDENGVKEAVIRLLQHDLGLKVVAADSRNGREKGSSIYSNIESEEAIRINGSPVASESPTRRPIVLQRLKVTRKSLHHWLQKRIGSSTQ